MDASDWDVQINIAEEIYELDTLHFQENPASLGFIRHFVHGEISPEDEYRSFGLQPGVRKVRVMGAFGRPMSRQYFIEPPEIPRGALI